MNVKLDPKEIYDLLRSGKIVRVKFIRRGDGEIRELIGRSRVRKGVKGVGCKYSFRKHGLVLMEDFTLAKKLPASKCYRSVPVDGVLEITAVGETYIIGDGPENKTIETVVPSEMPEGHSEFCCCVDCMKAR